MVAGGRRVALALVADGEVDLIRAMVDLLRPMLDRVVVVEGTRTYHGAVRETLGRQWQGLLGLDEPSFRSVVMELPPADDPKATMRRREMLQRAAVGLGVADLDPDDLAVVVDSDEFVAPAWLAAHAAAITVPIRLRLVPLYGGLDRRAPDWHCCAVHLQQPAGQWPPSETGWLFPGGVVGPISALAGRGAAHWRAAPEAVSVDAAGWHLLHLLPADGDPARKLTRQAHRWDPSADTAYLRRVLDAGIHPYGWWAATAMAVPSALRFVARRHPATVLGPLPPTDERQRLLFHALARFAGASTVAAAGEEHVAGQSEPS